MPHSFYTYFFLNIFPPFSFPFCLSFLLHFFLSKKEKTLFLFLFFIVVCLRFVWGKTGRCFLFFFPCTDPRWIFFIKLFSLSLSLSTFLFCFKTCAIEVKFCLTFPNCTRVHLFFFLFFLFPPLPRNALTSQQIQAGYLSQAAAAANYTAAANAAARAYGAAAAAQPSTMAAYAAVPAK
jgi:hypothetical protein